MQPALPLTQRAFSSTLLMCTCIIIQYNTVIQSIQPAPLLAQ